MKKTLKLGVSIKVQAVKTKIMCIVHFCTKYAFNVKGIFEVYILKKLQYLYTGASI